MHNQLLRFSTFLDEQTEVYCFYIQIKKRLLLYSRILRKKFAIRNIGKILTEEGDNVILTVPTVSTLAVSFSRECIRSHERTLVKS